MPVEIDFNKFNKVCLREFDDSQTLHLIVKTLIVQRLNIKHKKDRYWLRVYTESPVGSGKIADVVYQNIKSKECVAFEVQKLITKSWLENTKKAYDEWEILGMKTDWQLIDLNKCPQNWRDIVKWVDELII